MVVNGSTYTIRFDASLFCSDHWDDPEPSLAPVIVYTPTTALQNLEERITLDSKGIQVIEVLAVNEVDASASTPVTHTLVLPIAVGKNDASLGISGTTLSSFITVPTDHNSMLTPSNPQIDALVPVTSESTYSDTAVVPDFSNTNPPVISLPETMSEIATTTSLAEEPHDDCLSLDTGLSNDNVFDISSGSDSDSIESTITAAQPYPSVLGFPVASCVPPISARNQRSLSKSATLLSTETLLAEHLDMQVVQGSEYHSSINVESGSDVSASSHTSGPNHSAGLYDDLDMWINNSLMPATLADPSKSFAPPLLVAERLKDEPHSADSPNWANAPLAPVRSYVPRRVADTIQPFNNHIDDKYIGLPNSGAIAYDRGSWSFVESDTIISGDGVDIALPNDTHRRPTPQLTSRDVSASTASYSPPRSHRGAHEIGATGSRPPASITGRVHKQTELKRSEPRRTPITSVAQGVHIPPPSSLDHFLLGQEPKNRSAPTAVGWQEIIYATSDLDIAADQNVSREELNIIPNASPLSQSQSSLGLGRYDTSPGSLQHQLHSHPQHNNSQPRTAYDYSNSNHNDEPLFRHTATPRSPAPSQDVHQTVALHDGDKIPGAYSQWIALAELVAQRGTIITDVQSSPSLQRHEVTQDSHNFNARFDDRWAHDVNDDYLETIHDSRGTDGEHRKQMYDASNVSPSGVYISAGLRGLHGKTQLRQGYYEQRPDSIQNGTAQSRWADAESMYGARRPAAMPRHRQQEQPIKQNVASGAGQSGELLAPSNSSSYRHGPHWVPDWLQNPASDGPPIPSQSLRSS